MKKEPSSFSFWKNPLLWQRAWRDAFKKFHPRDLLRQPVLLLVEICAVIATVFFLMALWKPTSGSGGVLFLAQITLWLWMTLFFSTLAEAVAESRGRAQADTLRKARETLHAKRLRDPKDRSLFDRIGSRELRLGDLVLVEAGDVIPVDGEVLEGIASVDESAMTGESAPVIRAAGSDHNTVTGGTRLLSDALVIRVTAEPGESFLDQMIALVEGAKRKQTPTEIALSLLLTILTLLFVGVTITLFPYTVFSIKLAGQGSPPSVLLLVSLVVCLIPTTIGGLLSAIGIAGMDRMLQANVLAMSGRAVEAAGDVDVLLLDKTGTITHGNRRAVSWHPAPGILKATLVEAAWLSSVADETPEGRSLVELACHENPSFQGAAWSGEILPFQAETRMSGLDQPGRRLRKGASDAVIAWAESLGGRCSRALREDIEAIARQGGTPLVVADEDRLLGVIFLKDVLKQGIRERFELLRRMGIKTVMITGDNPLTAASIAAEAGVDDFLAEATPKAKLEKIRAYQSQGHLVAMMGDGTNDAPALAQADVAVAMQSGTQAAKEAANLIDLDSDPTKLIEVVGIGKQLLMTRGALTTFSLANDVAKYFAILPAAFVSIYPGLAALNLMRLHSPQSAVLSAVIFNALIILALIPLALRGIAYRPLPADSLLQRHLLLYGVGGLVLPFLGIKVIDLCLVGLGLIA